MSHAFFLKELALCTLMKFVELEAQYPLIKIEWKGTLTFPCDLLKVSDKTEKSFLSVTWWYTNSCALSHLTLYSIYSTLPSHSAVRDWLVAFLSKPFCQVVVDGLLPTNEDASLLISRFQEYMEYDDVRYFVMKAVTASICKVMQKTKEVTNRYWPGGSQWAARGCVWSREGLAVYGNNWKPEKWVCLLKAAIFFLCVSVCQDWLYSELKVFQDTCCCSFWSKL